MVAEHFKESFPQPWENMLSRQGGQIRGCSGPAVQGIISRFGQHDKIYSSEGGRTNREQRPAAEDLHRRLHDTGLGSFNESDRVKLLGRLQEYIYSCQVLPWCQRQRLSVEIDPKCSLPQIISSILEAARESKLAGPVAQHLVGAKLCLRFPDKDIPNYTYSASDETTERAGDFQVADTAIHVTVAPGEKVIARCEENISNGYRPLLLVPQGEEVQGARMLAGHRDLQDLLQVTSIEDFVGCNISEIGQFEQARINTHLAELLRVYNERVDEVETDKSIQIEPPKNLK